MDFTLVFIDDNNDDVPLIEAITKDSPVSYKSGSLKLTDCVGFPSSECGVSASREDLYRALFTVFGERHAAGEAVTDENVERKSWHCSGGNIIYIGPSSAPVIAPENRADLARENHDHIDTLRRNVEPL